MGYSRQQKQENHARIVAIAARRFRELGLDGLGVADIMKEAGLTHGGFYAHFASREQLVAEAIEFAFREDEDRLMRAMGRRPQGSAVEKFLDIYLTPAHRDTPGRGCTMAAIAPEAARRDPTVRNLFSSQIGRYADLLAAESNLPAETVVSVISASVGALTLSRAVEDAVLSESLLAGTKAAMLKLVAGQSVPPGA